MSHPVISVEKLSKRYILGHQSGKDDGLRHKIEAAMRSPLRWFRDRRQTVAKAHEEFWALKDVSFEVKQGDVVGIIGRNGAGKSTLLKILSRITEPTSGRIRIKGRVASLLEVGTGFHPELTGRENIFLNGAILGMSRVEIKKKFDEIVAFSEIEKFLDTPVKRYSSGMYVRLAFAVAAHLEPEILIVDEVLAVGDSEFQKKCLGKMQDVASGGRTVLFVSHNMGAVATLCQKGVLLEKGRLQLADSIERVVDTYLQFSEADVETDPLPFRQPRQGELVGFTRIEREGPSAGFAYGDPMAFRLTVEAKSNISELSVGASIFQRSGGCVGTLFTEATFDVKGGDKKTFRLSVPFRHLAPGSYYMGFSLGQGGFRRERLDFDIVIGIPSFRVLPRTGEAEMLASWHHGWGAVVLENTMEEVKP